MKNSLFGLIFLMSQFVWGMEATSSIRSQNTLHFSGINSPSFFSMFEIFIDAHVIKVLDDDGFATLALAIRYLEQNDNVLEHLIDMALDRLRKSRPKMADRMKDLSSKNLPALKVFQDFIMSNRNKFAYEFYDEARETLKWRSIQFPSLPLTKTKAPLPPMSITLAMPLNVDVNPKKTVAIEKFGNAPIEVGFLEKLFSRANNLEFTSSSSKPDSIKYALQSIEIAFPLFEKIRMQAARGYSRAGIAILPAEKVAEIAELAPKKAVNELEIFFSDQKSIRPEAKGTMPLYLVYFARWDANLTCGADTSYNEQRFWIFEVNQASPDNFDVTLKHRLGSEPDGELLELMFPKIDLSFEEISSL